MFHGGLNQRLWDRARRAVLRRDAWTCQTCGRYGNECDHILALKFAGAWYDLGNLQILCRGCHIEKTRAENTTADYGRKAWRELVSQMEKE
jgi:5-methylcytosine-specific restriction endonuclease McrA